MPPAVNIAAARFRTLGPLGIVLGVGVGMLANSRPWEGVLLSIPVGAAVLWWTFATTADRATQADRP